MVSCLGIPEVSAFQRCSLIEDLDFSLTSNVANISPDYATNTAQRTMAMHTSEFNL